MPAYHSRPPPMAATWPAPATMQARGGATWNPGRRKRKLFTALRADAAFATSADRVAVRDLDRR